MILVNKFDPQVILEEIHYRDFARYTELVKILDFVELPENLQKIEQQNSDILRNYYANALDHNIIDIKTVKYIVNQNIRARGINERAVEQYVKAEEWLSTQLNEPLRVSMLYQLHKFLILDLYNNRDDINLFNIQKTRSPEKLDPAVEMEIGSLFEFINNDREYHPVIQSWILHFKLAGSKLFSESQVKMVSLMHNFWLKKKGMDMKGLLSLEHELYIHKNAYRGVLSGEDNTEEEIEIINPLKRQVDFGMTIFSSQLERLKLLFRSYFRKQVEFEKLTPRQKNIMNYVFERGFRLNELDDTILNHRQKLIMYIIQHRGFISTKELVTEFDCNRKTIQRDFYPLVENNLVKVIGKGAGLRYAINLEERKHEYLMKYQADFLKEEDEDDIGFSEDE